MGWEVYDRPRRLASLDFAAAYTTLLGWLYESKALKPVDAWRLRDEMGIPTLDAWNPSPPFDQATRLLGLQHRHRRDVPCPCPSREDWELDQDRRCQRGDFSGFSPIAY